MSDEEQGSDGVSVHSGFPNPAADTRLLGLNLNQLLITHATSTYLFRVRGNEWEGQGVFDNDIAVIDRALDPRKNDVVLWWEDGGGEFALSHYKDMPKEVSYWGVVTSTIHELRRKDQQ